MKPTEGIPATQGCPERLPLSRVAVGYLLHCLVHLLCLPYLTANGAIRALRGRYKGIALTRLAGGGSPNGGKGSLIFVGTALGETRIAVRAATRLQQERSVRTAVWLKTTQVVEAAKRLGAEVPTAVAPFNNPVSALIGLLRWKPSGLVFIESARPMHLVFMARLLGVPTLLCNVKVSEFRSKRHGSRFMGAWRYRALGVIAVQAEIHRDRLMAMGVPASMIVVSGPELGSMMPPDVRRSKAAMWKEALSATAGSAPVVVAGSTHEQEEPIILSAFESFRRTHPSAVLVLAPRSTWRKGGPESTLKLLNLEYRRRSELNGEPLPSSRIVLLDTQGELQEVYSAAAVAFVGGTLVHGVGGHSPTEPLTWGVPVTLGPNFDHQEAVVAALAPFDFVSVCRTAEDLTNTWHRWADCEPDPDVAAQIGDLVNDRASVYHTWHDIVRRHDAGQVAVVN